MTSPLITIFYKNDTKIVTSTYNNFKQIIMKTKLFFIVIFAASLAGCSTIYKTGQTPDDVYYSPVRAISTGASENDNTPPTQYISGINQNNYYSNSEDRMIRMGISDSRYRYLDNNYGYSPYNFSYGYGNIGSSYLYDNSFSPYYSNLYYGNYYYNPYYNSYPVYITKSGPLKNTTPRSVNLNGYGRNYNNNNQVFQLAPHPTNNTNTNNGRTRNSSLGNLLNKVFTPAVNNTNTNNNQSPVSRTYTPAATNNTISGSSTSGSSSGGGHITRPH